MELDGVGMTDVYQGYGVAIKVDPGTHRIHYKYKASEFLSFDFSLLCEVGEPWIPSFRKLLADHKLAVEIHETETDYYERLKVAAPRRRAKSAPSKPCSRHARSVK